MKWWDFKRLIVLWHMKWWDVNTVLSSGAGGGRKTKSRKLIFSSDEESD